MAETSLDYNSLITSLEENATPLTENHVEEDILVRTSASAEKEIAVSDSTLNDCTALVETSKSILGTQNSIDGLSLHELVRLIFKKVDAIENHFIQWEVKFDNMRELSVLPSEITILPTGSIDMELLKMLGLPAESYQELEKLENNLKNDEEFKTKLVTEISIYVTYKLR